MLGRPLRTVCTEMGAFLILAGLVRAAIRVDEPFKAGVLGVAEPRGQANIRPLLVQAATGTNRGVGVAGLHDAVGYRPIHPVALLCRSS